MVQNFCLFFDLACSSCHSALLTLLSLESSLLVVLWELDELVDCELPALRFGVFCVGGAYLVGAACRSVYGLSVHFYQLNGVLL